MSREGLYEALATQTEAMRKEGTCKRERVLESPQAAHIRVAGGRPVLNMCANNYLGLANHPQVVAAARQSLDAWGYGLASVRFICGTQQLHKDLEDRISCLRDPREPRADDPGGSAMKAARRFLAVIAVALGMAGAPAAEAYEMVMIKDIVTRFRQIPGVADDPEAKAAARLLAERLLGRWEEVRRGVLQRVVPVSHTLVIEPL